MIAAWRLVVASLCVATCMHAAEAARAPAPAATAPALAPERALSASLRALTAGAVAWRGREETLLAVVRSSTSATVARRGAARLLTRLRPDPKACFDALRIASDAGDEAIVSIGAEALAMRLGDLPPARLIELGTPSVVASLLQRHPGDVLSDSTVSAAVRAWLSEATDDEAVLSLIGARGTVGDWGPVLVEQFSGDQPERLPLLHRALEHLTRTHKSLDVYGRNVKILARDWNEIIANHGTTAKADAQLLAAAMKLSDEDRTKLLRAGIKSVPALITAQASASAAQRAELAALARLCARWVTPDLLAQAAKAGVADMDHPLSDRRRAAMISAATVISSSADALNLPHLLSYLDDRDASVRIATLERLLRMGDERSRFKREWNTRSGGCFGGGILDQRLRRSLRDGGNDEKLSAMAVAAAVSSSGLSQQVAELLLSAQPEIVDSALETLSHLGLDSAAQKTLLAMAKDTRQPSIRRARILTALAQNNPPSGFADELLPLMEDRDALVVKAAGDALERSTRYGSSSSTDRKALTRYRSLASSTSATLRRVAARTIAVEPNTPGVPGTLLQQLAFDDDSRVAAAAAEKLHGFLENQRDDSSSSRSGSKKRPVRTGLAKLLYSASSAWMAAAWRSDEHSAVALKLDLLRFADVLPRLHSASASVLVSEMLNRADGFAHIVSISERLGSGLDRYSWQILRIVRNEIACIPWVADALVSNNSYGLSHYLHDASQSYTNDAVTVTLKDGRTWSLKQSATGAAWITQRPPPPTQALLDQIQALLTIMGKSKGHSHSDVLALSTIISGQEPTAALISELDEDDNEVKILVHRFPSVRRAVIAKLNEPTHEIRIWSLRSWLKPGDPSLLPAALRALEKADEEYETRELATWLFSLSTERLVPYAKTLAGVKALQDHPGMLRVLEQAGPLSADQTLRLIIQGGARPSLRVAAGSTIAAKALTDLTPARVLADAELLWRIREAHPESFDRAVNPIIDSDTSKSAAWLRSGLALRMGRSDAYRAATSARSAGKRLAGWAWLLSQRQVSATEAVQAFAGLPVAELHSAAVVLHRYAPMAVDVGDDSWRTIVSVAPLDSLPLWLPLAVPTTAVRSALEERVSSLSAAQRAACRAVLTTLLTQHPSWASLIAKLDHEDAAERSAPAVESDSDESAPSLR